jgi:hypothetical protein
MADEIKIRFSATVENGNHKDSIQPGTISIDQSNPGRAGHVQSVGTSEEVVDFGDVTTEGVLFLRNADSTNYVDFGPESAGSMVALGRLEAGEIAFLRMKPAVVLRAQANTAAVLLDVRLYED